MKIEDEIDVPNTVTGELVWALKALGYGAPKTGVRATGTWTDRFQSKKICVCVYVCV